MSATKPYRPSNGSEGEWFQSEFCELCEKDRRQDKPCRILGRSMAFNVDEPGYPKEWVCDADEWPGNPRCTAFVERSSHALTRPNVIKDKRQEGLPL